MMASRPTGSNGSIGHFVGLVAWNIIKHSNTFKLN